MTEIAEIATLIGAGVGRVLLCQGGKIRSLVELGDDLLRLGLGLEEDVTGMHLLARRLFLQEGLVAGLQLILGLALPDRAVEIRLLDQAVLIAFQAALDLGVAFEVVLAPGLGQQRAIDEPIEQHRVDLVERQLLCLGRQALLRRFDIG